MSQRLRALLAWSCLAAIITLGSCDDAVNIDRERLPENTYFALAITDNSWSSHDIANLVKLDFGGPVRPDTVVPLRVSTPPVVDGSGGDSVWSRAETTELILSPVNGGCGIVAASVKSVYTDEEIFFLISWMETGGSRSDRAGRWVYHQGEWYNRYDDAGAPDHDGRMIAEDMVAFFWQIGDTAPLFPQQGCSASCHSDGLGGYRHATKPGEYWDCWVWGAARTNPLGQADDLYLTVIGLLEDPGIGPYIVNQFSDEEFHQPLYQHVQDPNANVHHLLIEDAVEFDPEAAWQQGSTIPGFILRQAEASRADVRAAGRYSGGAWVLELGRRLDTGWPHHDHIFTWRGDGSE